MNSFDICNNFVVRPKITQRFSIVWYFLFCYLLIISNDCYSSDYYWVNNSGRWSDFSNHWATISGGSVFYSQPPTLQDDVYFDANSFSSGSDTLFIDSSNVTCHSMIWAGSLPVQVKGLYSYNDLHIHGSLKLISGLNWISTTIEFNSTGNDSLDFGNNILNINLNFYGTGQWKINSDINISANINLWQGTVKLNGHAINCSLLSNDPSRHQVLNVDNCIINCNTWSTSHSVVTSALSSIITCNGFSCSGGPAIFHVVNAATAFTAGDSCVFDTVTSGQIQIGRSRINYLHQLASSQYGFTSNNANIGYGIFTGHVQRFSGTLTVDTIEFDPGVKLNLDYAAITINNKINLNGTCSEMAYVYTDYTGSITKLFGTVNFDYVRFKKINATGGANFIASNSINEAYSTGITFTNPPRNTLYWVNGNGHWGDPNHWSTTSGGSPGSCVPFDLTDVIFDANSFTNSTDTVYADADKLCKSFNWICTQPHVIIDSSVNSFKIWGSLNLDTSVQWKIFSTIHIISDSVVNLNSGNKLLLNDILFDSSCVLHLMSNLNMIDGSRFDFRGNSFYTNSFNMNCDEISLSATGIAILNNSQIVCTNFSEGVATNHLNTGNSVIICKKELNSSVQHYTGIVKVLGLRFQPSSHFAYLEATYAFGNGGLFDRAIFFEDTIGSYPMAIWGTNNVFKYMELKCRVCSLQTSYQADTLIANTPNQRIISQGGTVNHLLQINGNCNGLIYLSGDIHANGTNTLSNLYPFDLIFTGTSATAVNSIDGGGNTGLSFSSPLTSRQLYWVNGQGNWDDVNHWSLMSGGLAGECVPNPNDDVFVDSGSAIATGDTVFLDVSTVTMKSMHCSYPAFFSGSHNFINQYFDVYGSFLLSPGAIFNTHSYHFRFLGNQLNADIDENANPFLIYSLDIKGPGSWNLLSDFNIDSNFWNVYVRNLYTNGYKIQCTNDLNFKHCTFDTSSVYCRNLDLDTVFADSSYMYCSGYFNNSGDNFNVVKARGINVTSSKIRDAECEDFGGGNCTINKLKIDTSPNYYINIINSHNDTIGFCEVEGPLDSIDGNPYFDTLSFVSPGQQVYFNGGTTTINSSLLVNSNSSSPNTTTIFRDGTIVKSAGILCIDSVQMRNLHATGGASFFAGANSIDLGSNSGWIFVTCGTQASINETASDKILLYPNPATEILNVIMPDDGTHTYKLIDSVGRIVLTGTIKGNECSISCASLFKGLYFLQIASDNETISKKIIIN
jgi:hypothetical protein